MRRIGLIVVAVGLLAFLAGCAQKPQKEIDDVTAAMNAVIKDGLGKYAPEDEKKLKDSMAAINAEIKVQEEKTFKDFDKTKQMLADLQKTANDMKQALPAKKEKAKQDAMAAADAAKAAAEEAKKMLAKAPKGKGTAADIEALKGDVKGVGDMLAEVQGLIEKEDYLQAVAKAKAVKEKAAAVTGQIQQALEKAKPAAKPAKGQKPAPAKK
jgi:tRNA U34 5-carboxymethylaminomethyl modifying GTPase MnmE/TrmE